MEKKNTNWNTYKTAIEKEIEYNPLGNYQELEQIVHSTALKAIGMYNNNFNQVYNNQNIKTARHQKRTAKKKLQQVIKTKSNMEIKFSIESHKNIWRKLLLIMKLKLLRKNETI